MGGFFFGAAPGGGDPRCPICSEELRQFQSLAAKPGVTIFRCPKHGLLYRSHDGRRGPDLEGGEPAWRPARPHPRPGPLPSSIALDEPDFDPLVVANGARELAGSRH